jgi:hypothetical protein
VSAAQRVARPSAASAAFCARRGRIGTAQPCETGLKHALRPALHGAAGRTIDAKTHIDVRAPPHFPLDLVD